MRFYERLRRLREQKGLTWYRLAKLSGIPKQTLSRLEQPTSNPTLGTLCKLAAALRVTVEELVKDAGQQQAKRKRGNQS